ncbi:MAG: response regulator [Myxococcales bacterium]
MTLAEDEWVEESPTWPNATMGKRVLVAEDDAAMRQMLAMVLHERGYLVDCVGSGTDMLSVLAQCGPRGYLAERFALILTDVRMPGASGLDAIDQLRRDGDNTPVIAVTAFPHDATLHRAERLGIRLLAKPFDLDALRSAVTEALESTT